MDILFRRTPPELPTKEIKFFQPPNPLDTKSQEFLDQQAHFAQFVATSYKADPNPFLEETEVPILEVSPEYVRSKVRARSLTKSLIENTKYLFFRVFDNDLRGFEKLSFAIPPKDVFRIIGNINEILQDPQIVLSCLQDLDQELAAEMLAKGIDIADNPPQYFIAGNKRFMIGPAPKSYQPFHKGGILNKILLRREQETGINIDGVATFDDFVNYKIADDFVAKGHLFSENEQAINILQHGKYSHRLAFEIFRQAQKKGLLDLSYGDAGQSLTYQQLLEIFTKMQIHGRSVWADSIDRVTFTLSSNPRNPSDYDSDCGSPFILTSLIASRGEAVPSLQKYILDNHYKQRARMVRKLRIEDKDGVLAEVPDDFIETQCSIFMDHGMPGDFIKTPFEAEQKHKYKPFSDQYEGTGVVRKKSETSLEVRKYESLQEFAAHKDFGR